MGEYDNGDSFSPDPPVLVHWKQLTAEVPDLDDMLDEAEERKVKIFDVDVRRWKSPVGRLSLKAFPVELDDNAVGIGYEGRIDFTGNLEDKLTASIFVEGQERSLVPADGKDGPFSMRRISNRYAIEHNHAYGVSSVVYAPRGRDDRLVVANHVDIADRKFRPPTVNSIDRRSSFEAFMQAYLRTAVYSRNLTQPNPNDWFMSGKLSLAKPQTSEGNAAAGRKMNIDGAEVIMPGENRTRLVDIGGLEQERKILSQIALSFRHPEVMAKWDARRPQGIILHGPPGTGKTMLVHALANEADAELWTIQSSDIYNKWLGNSEKAIKNIFSKAKRHKGHLVLFFDEFEAIVGISRDSDGGSQASNRVAGIFKQEMNDLYKVNPNVLVPAATNDLDSIDGSLRRSGRFDYVLAIPLPDVDGRTQIIAGQIQNTLSGRTEDSPAIFDDTIAVPDLAKLSDGFSGADIAEVFRRIKLDKAMQEVTGGTEPTPINQDDIAKAIRNLRGQSSIM